MHNLTAGVHIWFSYVVMNKNINSGIKTKNKSHYFLVILLMG